MRPLEERAGWTVEEVFDRIKTAHQENLMHVKAGLSCR
jgi:hypothetical protein